MISRDVVLPQAACRAVATVPDDGTRTVRASSIVVALRQRELAASGAGGGGLDAPAADCDSAGVREGREAASGGSGGSGGGGGGCGDTLGSHAVFDGFDIRLARELPDALLIQNYQALCHLSGTGVLLQPFAVDGDSARAEMARAHDALLHEATERWIPS